MASISFVRCRRFWGGACLDLGYFEPGPSPWAAPASDDPVIAIGHSLGFAWLLHHQPFRWNALVSINGFARFVSPEPNTGGVASRVLARMIARFEEQPATVHAAFLERCGAARPEPANLRVEPLAEGLRALADWDERETLRAQKAPVLALAGRQDPIVSPALTEETFQTIAWHDEAGHLLPLTHPRWCAERILQFAESADV